MSRVTFFDAYPHVYAGAQRSTQQLAVGLRRCGWDVEVVLPDDGAFAETLRAGNVPLRVVPVPPALRHYGHTTTGARAVRAALALPRYWWRLRSALRGRADVIHVNDQRGMVLAGPAARLAGVPVVWHVHGVRPPRAINAIGRVLARRTVALTAADAARLATPLRKDAPDVVANAPDAAYFGVERRPVSPPLVVTVGRLSPVKGIDVLLRAVAALRSNGTALALEVLGGQQPGYEDHAEQLNRLRQSLGLDDVVTFAGHVADTREALARATVYAQPARWEGVPLAVLEAMAAGIPVVATDVGGVRDVITPEVTGLLVPPDDAAALATALARLLDTPELAARLGDAGREWARARSAELSSPTRMAEIYRAVLA